MTVGERDATSPNIGEYNRFVQAEAPVAGARALISTSGVDARDNTATAGTGGVPIWWLGATRWPTTTRTSWTELGLAGGQERARG